MLGEFLVGDFFYRREFRSHPNDSVSTESSGVRVSRLLLLLYLLDSFESPSISIIPVGTDKVNPLAE